jgi:hypothetical protein
MSCRAIGSTGSPVEVFVDKIDRWNGILNDTALVKLFAVSENIIGERYADRAATFRATLMSAEAWSVLPGGRPSYEAPVIGRKISGRPRPMTIRDFAKNQKPRSLLRLVS